METKCITFDKKTRNSLPEHIKDKMKYDIELATFEGVKCHYCGDDCISSYMGDKMCAKCMAKQSEACEFAEWYLQNDKNYNGSIFSVYKVWVNLGRPPIITLIELF